MARGRAHPRVRHGTWTNHTPRRRRKLLLHRAELARSEASRPRAGTPSSRSQLYFKDGRAKVEIAVAKGKKQYDKRQALRERQDTRDTQRALSQARRASGEGR